MPKYIVSDKLYQTKNSGEFRIIKVENAHNIWIEFVNTGNVKKVEHSAIFSQTIKDYEAPSVCGVGIIGNSCAKMTGITKPKSVWADMLLRCYDENSKYYKNCGGNGIIVCTEWLYFPNFLSWFGKNYKEGYELDKDLKGGRIYSPDSAIFIPFEVNAYLRFARKNRSLPTGVSLEKKSGKYYAHIKYSYNGKRKNLGGYNAPEGAFEVYRKEKEKDLNIMIDIWYEGGVIDDTIKDLLSTYKIKPYPDQ